MQALRERAVARVTARLGQAAFDAYADEGSA
jgi:hypothetical protein